MREIKFNLWLSIQKEMLRSYYISDDSITFYMENHGAIPLQYTGLKDSKETEIFEGDILKTLRENGEIIIEKVFFENGAFKINLFKENINLENFIYWIRGNNYTTQVIGNIYEHPHLLENK